MSTYHRLFTTGMSMIELSLLHAFKCIPFKNTFNGKCYNIFPSTFSSDLEQYVHLDLRTYNRYIVLVRKEK